MFAMQTLRNAHQIARFVLVWFALSIGVAIASPLVKPQNTLLVCSATGALTVQAEPGNDDGNGAAPLPHTLDCPLCAALSAPPPQPSLEAAPPMGLTYQLREAPDVQSPRRCAAAFAPRGPPASL
jgi:hypothetical protein